MNAMVKPAPYRSPEEQLQQLRFLHRIARLATTARTWDELLETIVDETRDALHADVSSLYLLDRDGSAPDSGRDQRPRPSPDRPGPGAVTAKASPAGWRPASRR